jgi:uncharacterized protein (TIGR02284 family)
MNTSTTFDTLDDLMATLEDGTTGFTDAAERLDDLGRKDLGDQLRDLATQRSEFHAELKVLSNGLGHDTTDDGTITAKLHRGWMSVKDALSGDRPTGVLQVAEQGEAHAVTVYETASKTELPEPIHLVVDRQFGDVRTAHAKVTRLLETALNAD